jgi:AcrR family transcriptional regulator
MARRSPRVVETQQRILDAALELFGDKGFHCVTIDEIASRAGVTKGAVYYYFEDTADLARDLARQILDRLAAAARRAIDPDGDTITNLERGFDTFLAGLQSQREARFFLRDCRALPGLDPTGDDSRAGSMAVVRTLLERGIERGEIEPCDADALAHVLIGACADAMLHVIVTERSTGAVEVMHRIFASLAARPKGGDPS